MPETPARHQRNQVVLAVLSDEWQDVRAIARAATTNDTRAATASLRWLMQRGDAEHRQSVQGKIHHEYILHEYKKR